MRVTALPIGLLPGSKRKLEKKACKEGSVDFIQRPN